MIQAMREKLGREIEDLTRELTVTLPQAIATAVAMGDLRENSEYKAALERQQLVQARLGQLHHRLEQIAQLANTEAPRDRVGLGSKVFVEDVKSGDQETYTVVFAEMMDLATYLVFYAITDTNDRNNRRNTDNDPYHCPKAAQFGASYRVNASFQVPAG